MSIAVSLSPLGKTRPVAARLLRLMGALRPAAPAPALDALSDHQRRDLGLPERGIDRRQAMSAWR